MNNNAGRAYYLFLTTAFILTVAVSQPFVINAIAAEVNPNRNEQLIIQQQRQRALEQQLKPPAPDVRLSLPPSSLGKIRFPNESPCFLISHIELSGQKRLPHWLPLQRLANQGQGRCLGVKGINLLMSTIQNRLIDHGYITTRVLAPSQDLKSGTLKLTIVPGSVRQVQLTPDSSQYIRRFSTFPAHAGELLDLRDIEQGLENLQRLPTVQASIEIVPGEQPGESDIILRRLQRKMWRLGVFFDDVGTKSTGRYQGGLTLSLDNPFSLSDLFYISALHALDKRGGKGTRNISGHYSFPFGYWLFSLNANDYDYHQTVAELNSDIRYSGTSRNLNAELSRVLHRSGTQKTWLSYGVSVRESKNFINDTEIGVQRRLTSAWNLGLQHRHYLEWATIDAGISYQRGTRWFGARPAPEEYFGEATALSKIVRFNAQIDLPFRLIEQNLHYNLLYQKQISSTPLTPQDQFSIGTRWTVRGFDGERLLSADSGWFVRNDIGWYMPLAGQELYTGIDYGEIGKRGSAESVGRRLAGGVIGWRGNAFNTNYDFFAGIPLSKPDGYRTSPVTLGFNLSWDY